MTASFPSANSARDAGRGSAIRLGAEIVVRCSSIAATLWLTRSLGVGAFGSLLVCLSAGLMLAELCDLGINAIAVPLVVKDRGALRSLLAAKVLLTGGVALLSSLLIPLFAWASGVDRLLLALATLHFVFVSWVDVAGSTLRSLGRRVDEALLLLLSRFALLTLVIAAPFGSNVDGVVRAYAAAVVPAALLGVVWLRPEITKGTPGGPSLRSILLKAAPLGVNGYLAILSTRIEIFLLQIFMGEPFVGLFGGALRIVESLLTLPAAIAAGALPSVARDLTRGTRGAVQRTFGLVVWIAAPSALGILLCAPAILSILGPGFVAAAPALRVLSISLFLCFANAALFHVLIAAGDTSAVPRLTGARLVMAALSGLVLIPSLGLVGAALSFTLAEAALFGALVRKTRAYAQVQVLRPVGFAFLACVPMVMLLSLGRLSLPASILWSVCLFAGAGAAILRRGTVASGLS